MSDPRRGGRDAQGGAPSLMMRATAAFLRLTRPRAIPTETLRAQYGARDYPPIPPPTARMARRYLIEQAEVGGWPVIALRQRSDGAEDRARHQILYLPGGAYVNMMLARHWDIVDHLARATGADVTVAPYPLAPEHDHRAAFAYLDQVCARMLTRTDPERIVLCGDSAGGGLAMGLALARQRAGHTPFGRMILFAPWLDLTLADPRARRIEPRDVMLSVDRLREMGRWWAGDEDPRLPLLSPLHADLDGLPPIDIHQGGDDILSVDARTLAARGGDRVRLYDYPGAFHVFMAAPFLPEARQVYRRVARDLGRDDHGPGD